jgi:serine/threonine protein kinase
MSTEVPGIDLGIDGIDHAVRIGQGSFGSVYRAEQPRFRRTVAVKVISTALVDDESRRVFERECQALGTLSGHPYIVTLYGAGISTDNHPYLVMDFLPGGALSDRLAEGRLPWEDAVSIGVKLAAALATAHGAGMLHRDIKPENVLMSAYGEPQLADFGVAKLQGGTRTTMGMITGSVAHAAPEVLSGRPASPASDVWSLASTVATLLSGSPPFHRDGDESLQPLLMRIITGEPNDLRPFGVPDEVCAAITAALAKDSWERTPTAVAFGQALVDAQRRLGVPVTPMPLLRGDTQLPAGIAEELPVQEASATGAPVDGGLRLARSAPLATPEPPATVPLDAGPDLAPPEPPATPATAQVDNGPDLAPMAGPEGHPPAGELWADDLLATRRRAAAPLAEGVAPAAAASRKAKKEPAPPARERRPRPSPAHSRPRLPVVVGAASAAVVLVVVLALALSGGGTKHGSAASAGSTPATGAAAPRNPTSPPATTTTQPPVRTVFQDDFTNRSSGWAPEAGQEGNGASAYQADGLHVVEPKPLPNALNAFSVASPTQTRLSSLQVTVTLTFVAAAPTDGAGLRCDQGDRAHLRYSFEVHPNGTWVIFKIDDQGQPTALAQGSNTTAIQGGSASTLMTATCVDAGDGTTKLGMIVNGINLGSASDTHPQPIKWHTGVVAYRSTPTQNTEIRFNNFKLVDISSA